MPNATGEQKPNVFCPAAALDGSAVLPFVIPTGAKRSGGICGSADSSWECFFRPSEGAAGLEKLRHSNTKRKEIYRGL